MTMRDPDVPGEGAPSSAEYCRRVETYLCRKNDGHLIRVVGPAFECVTGLVSAGIPLNVAYRGIDRHFERLRARGPRRWPVRVEFCDADVRQAFDEWRRAVGALASRATIVAEDGGAGADLPVEDAAEGRRRRTPSLSGHLERVAIRLSSVLAGTSLPRAAQEALADATREVDRMRATARGLRGAARQQVVDDLVSLERRVLGAVLGALPDATRAAVRARAETDLAPFQPRMAPPAYEAALHAATLREVRHELRLPAIAVE